MPRVVCDVEMCDVTDGGVTLPGVKATCPNCDLTTQSFGQGESSVKRCMVLLRENCEGGEEDEKNFYVQDTD